MLRHLLLILMISGFANAFTEDKTILLFGDSITERGDSYRSALVPSLLKKDLKLKFIGPKKDSISAHAGYSGKNTAQLKGMAQKIYSKYPADIVLFHSGHNSFAKDKPVAKIINDTESIIITLREINPDVIILLGQVITAGKLPKYSYIPELNIELEKLAERLNNKTSKIILVNHAEGFDWKSDTNKDKVHVNANGAKKMADKWLEALVSILK